MLFLTLSYFFFLILGAEWPCQSQCWAFGPKNIFHSIHTSSAILHGYTHTTWWLSGTYGGLTSGQTLPPSSCQALHGSSCGAGAYVTTAPPPRVPVRMWQRCAGRIYAVRGLCVIFQLHFFNFLILIQLIQCLWSFKHIKACKNI